MKEKQFLPKAAALSYDDKKDMAPRVVAKGQGLIAQHIKELASLHNIPIREDEVLLDYLMALDLNTEIPPELYQVVAEILAFIYRVDQRYQGR